MPPSAPRRPPARPPAAGGHAHAPHARQAEDVGATPPGRGWRAWLRRALLMTLAVASLGLAVIGAVLPGLPSTVFVLVSAWAAARSSPRLDAWLHRNRYFGPALHHWDNGRRVSRRGKWSAGIGMAICAVILLVAVPQRWAAWLGIGCMTVVLFWLCRRPEP